MTGQLIIELCFFSISADNSNDQQKQGGISKDENRITGRLAPVTPAINAITLAATT